jgi:NADPH2:quinone reductase
MRRVIIKTFGGLEQLPPETVEAPRPGPGQLLVDIEAAGVNYLDVYQRSGTSKVSTAVHARARGAPQ